MDNSRDMSDYKPQSPNKAALSEAAAAAHMTNSQKLHELQINFNCHY